MKHLRENRESYIAHLKFAGKIGLTLIRHGLVFLLHALLPMIEIPKRLNLEATRNKLDDWNSHTIRRRKK